MPDVLSTTKTGPGGIPPPVDSKGGRWDGTPDALDPVVPTVRPAGTETSSAGRTGQEEPVSPSNLIVMFRDCPFCGSTHRSPYVDELESSVMSCREKAHPEKRGDLDAWPEGDTLPVRCETEALSRAA